MGKKAGKMPAPIEDRIFGGPQPSSDPVKVEAHRAELLKIFGARHQQLFEATGNDAHALAYYRLARRLALPSPEWVLKAVDRLVEATPRQAAGAETDARNLAIVQRIALLKDPARGADAMTRDGAFEVIAQEYALSIAQVRDIWYRSFNGGPPDIEIIDGIEFLLP